MSDDQVRDFATCDVCGDSFPVTPRNWKVCRGCAEALNDEMGRGM